MNKIDIDFEKLPKTIAIVGSRDFPSLSGVRHFVNRLEPDSEVVSGGARGVDRIAEETAELHDMKVKSIRPKRNRIEEIGFRNAAFERNREIVMYTKKNNGVVFVFKLEPPKTGGTDNTISHCENLLVPFVVFRMSGEGLWLDTQMSIFSLEKMQGVITLP